MTILTLTTSQKSVCAIPNPGVEGTPEWASDASDLFSIEAVAEDGLTATVVASDGSEGGAGFLTVTTDDGTTTVIATLEVRVSGDNIRFADVSASTPDTKQPEARDRESARE